MLQGMPRTGFPWRPGEVYAIMDGRDAALFDRCRVVPNLAPEPTPAQVRKRRNPMPAVPRGLKLERVS